MTQREGGNRTSRDGEERPPRSREVGTSTAPLRGVPFRTWRAGSLPVTIRRALPAFLRRFLKLSARALQGR